MNIVMVPFHDYKKWVNEGFRTRDSHLYEHFVKDDKVEKVLVVNRPTSLAEVLLKRKSWKTYGGEIEYASQHVQLKKMSDKSWCIDIFLFDFFSVITQRKLWWFSAFNNSKVIEEINKCIEYLNMQDNILLLQNPMAIGVAKYIKCNKFVFDAIDNWLFHPQMPDKDIIRVNYDYVDENADLILTVSEDLVKTFSKNKNIKWIPNGVDCNFFSDAVTKLKCGTESIIGYVGKIQDRVDFALVEKCLKNMQNRFVFIGPIYSQRDVIKKLKEKYSNIDFIGDVHYNNLPSVMKEIDVAIMPHVVNDFTNSMNPLKLYEYLASGKPVVTTRVAGTSTISSYVHIAFSDDEFVNDLKILVETVDKIEPQKIIESIPMECTWKARTETILALFSELKRGMESDGISNKST